MPGKHNLLSIPRVDRGRFAGDLLDDTLLAGNISIVHGVTGSSRTFMGEEIAGVDAVRIALQARFQGNDAG